MNKVVRLPDGRFITRKLVESDPVALAKAKPEEIWTMNDGKSNSGKTNYTRPILIRDMETSHLINAMNVVYRREYEKLRKTGTPGFNIIDPDKNKNTNTRNIVTKLCLETVPVYKTMHDELAIRLGKKPRAKAVEEQPKRCFNFE